MPGNHLSHFAIIAIGLILLSQHSGAWAGEERDVAIPLIFDHDDGTEIKTSACLRVREKVYSADVAPWTSFRSQARSEPETILTETIAAMQNKDSARLKESSHPSLARDPQKFQKQAPTYFRHVEGLKRGNVWGYYRFADRLVFLFKLDFRRNYFTQFPFARGETGKFGLLPYGETVSLPFDFVSTWFHSDWGPYKTRSPVYCTPSLLKRMTHKVPLDKRFDKRLERYGSYPLDPPAELLLIGRNFTDKEIKDQPYAALRDKFSALNDALKAGRWDEYFDILTEHGRKRLEGPFLGGQEEERKIYAERILTQEPFYVFNADPVFIVFTRAGSSGIRVRFFVPDKKGQFRWANASYVTSFDRIFRVFTKAAGEEKPFDSWKITGSTRTE